MEVFKYLYTLRMNNERQNHMNNEDDFDDTENVVFFGEVSEAELNRYKRLPRHTILPSDISLSQSYFHDEEEEYIDNTKDNNISIGKHQSLITSKENKDEKTTDIFTEPKELTSNFLNNESHTSHILVGENKCNSIENECKNTMANNSNTMFEIEEPNTSMNITINNEKVAESLKITKGIKPSINATFEFSSPSTTGNIPFSQKVIDTEILDRYLRKEFTSSDESSSEEDDNSKSMKQDFTMFEETELGVDVEPSTISDYSSMELTENEKIIYNKAEEKCEDLNSDYENSSYARSSVSSVVECNIVGGNENLETNVGNNVCILKPLNQNDLSTTSDSEVDDSFEEFKEFTPGKQQIFDLRFSKSSIRAKTLVSSKPYMDRIDESTTPKTPKVSAPTILINNSNLRVSEKYLNDITNNSHYDMYNKWEEDSLNLICKSDLMDCSNITDTSKIEQIFEEENLNGSKALNISDSFMEHKIVPRVYDNTTDIMKNDSTRDFRTSNHTSGGNISVTSVNDSINVLCKLNQYSVKSEITSITKKSLKESQHNSFYDEQHSYSYEIKNDSAQNSDLKNTTVSEISNDNNLFDYKNNEEIMKKTKYYKEQAKNELLNLEPLTKLLYYKSECSPKYLKNSEHDISLEEQLSTKYFDTTKVLNNTNSSDTLNLIEKTITDVTFGVILLDKNDSGTIKMEEDNVLCQNKTSENENFTSDLSVIVENKTLEDTCNVSTLNVNLEDTCNDSNSNMNLEDTCNVSNSNMNLEDTCNVSNSNTNLEKSFLDKTNLVVTPLLKDNKSIILDNEKTFNLFYINQSYENKKVDQSILISKEESILAANYNDSVMNVDCTTVISSIRNKTEDCHNDTVSDTVLKEVDSITNLKDTEIEKLKSNFQNEIKEYNFRYFSEENPLNYIPNKEYQSDSLETSNKIDNSTNLNKESRKSDEDQEFHDSNLKEKKLLDFTIMQQITPEVNSDKKQKLFDFSIIDHTPASKNLQKTFINENLVKKDALIDLSVADQIWNLESVTMDQSTLSSELHNISADSNVNYTYNNIETTTLETFDDSILISSSVSDLKPNLAQMKSNFPISLQGNDLGLQFNFQKSKLENSSEMLDKTIEKIENLELSVSIESEEMKSFEESTIKQQEIIDQIPIIKIDCETQSKLNLSNVTEFVDADKKKIKESCEPCIVDFSIIELHSHPVDTPQNVSVVCEADLIQMSETLMEKDRQVVSLDSNVSITPEHQSIDNSSYDTDDTIVCIQSIEQNHSSELLNDVKMDDISLIMESPEKSNTSESFHSIELDNVPDDNKRKMESMQEPQNQEKKMKIEEPKTPLSMLFKFRDMFKSSEKPKCNFGYRKENEPLLDLYNQSKSSNLLITDDKNQFLKPSSLKKPEVIVKSRIPCKVEEKSMTKIDEFNTSGLLASEFVKPKTGIPKLVGGPVLMDVSNSATKKLQESKIPSKFQK
ncbi:protein PFF0380w-like isoform X2 [Daktulosphaira vitifoliae]|uniref:protein PFF0380w-like isoform X2 n=1 Tax=Daktulosphaira vitifoliae TaxID=58002 RepID=UPI0021A9A0FD|nr:protein PFF0380w-like isoform X2 [Daktulosphaira vitifoliae]